MTGLWIAFGIGLVVVLVFGGALLGFAVSPADQREQEPAAPEALRLVSFQPVAWSGEMKHATVAQIVDNIEQHLREEGRAAEAFARDPSIDSLRLQ